MILFYGIQRLSNMNEFYKVKILKKSSEELANVFKDEFIGLILFGSWARGEAKADSDIDLLIVFKSLKGFDIRAIAYSIIAKQVKMPLTLVDIRLSELVSNDYELTPLMLNILYDGIIIWDKYGLLKDFVEKGRRLIEKMKLVRYKTQDGKYGWKRIDEKPIALCGIVSE
jgi:predicted nucleotidyltransferase